MQPEQNQNYWQPSAEPQADAPAPVTPDPLPVPDQPQVPAPAQTDEPLSWQASEFVHHEKEGAWFLALLGVTIALLLIDFFLVRSWTFGALIIVMAIAVVVIARRPPRTITYTLSSRGIRIDEKQFNFQDFRAFGIVQENAFYSIRLVPSKRFMPMVSVFFPTEYGEEIAEIFGHALPMENIERDAIDKLVEKIRF
jgi:hypothetical protein